MVADGVGWDLSVVVGVAVAASLAVNAALRANAAKLQPEPEPEQVPAAEASGAAECDVERPREEKAAGCCEAEGAGEGSSGCGCAAATKEQTASSDEEPSKQPSKELAKQTATVLHASLTGTAKGFALELAAAINGGEGALAGYGAVARDLGEYSDSAGADIEDQLQAERLVIFVVATYEGGVAPGRSAGFVRWLSDFANDFRVNKTIFAGVRFAVFGCGNSDYDANFNGAAKSVSNAMLLLGAQQVHKRGDGDDSVNMGTQFATWQQGLIDAIANPGGQRAERVRAPQHPAVGRRSTRRGSTPGEVRLPLKEYRRQKRRARERAEAERLAAEGGGGSSSAEDSGGSGDEEWVDMEDIASIMAKKKAARKPAGAGAKESKPKPMVTPRHHAQLTKEGYKVIGTHSAVKLCRWTKAQLRGRGGCYKHTFYGITSYQCMEATPSLSCANKCVFCWRHHKNPVGREWRWETDNPEMLVTTAIEKHQQMIKELRGMPGVIPERMEEAMTVAHCALSLVGEPIMYPYIDEFVQYLHERQISSFLVTNAQFPEAIRKLPPVTQLYVSIDAGNKKDLQAVDRPLFGDFWERFLACLDMLREKEQRTVYRVTLLKGYNMSCIEEYAALVARGRPTFIEIKGVTFCGDSKASDMTMSNVPYHEEVREFAQLVSDACGPEYELASEHAHSNCMLVGRVDMKVDGVFQTWIDYPKFHELIAKGEHFTAADYMAPTPDWAAYNPVYAGEATTFCRHRESI
eukprot:COSAG04_NODE_460_length_13977_cov_5.936662_11_plen_748_part_00